ncbi:MAG: serine hydrolase domain-containing protein [Thermomicrobiales bacterium]
MGTVETAKDWTFDESVRSRVDRVFARWDSTATPGCALGIYREGEIVYTRGYGMSNLEHGIPIATDSIFHIASISKQFTDMCIALLAAEGALNVDDDVRLYVPEVPDFGPTITIRHLIHHVSGLRDQWSLLVLAGWREEDLVTERDVMELVTRQTALNFEPNTEYLYSNTGYTLLAIIVRRVSGRSLRAFAQERIFGPLGMTRTHFHDDHSEIVPGRTQAYTPRAGGGYHISIPEFDVVGTTSLFTTVEDLAKWDGNFTSARIGGPDLIAQLQTPGTFADGTPMTYAWGLMVDTYRGARQIGHGGADHGYRSDYFRLPEFGLTVTVLSNISDSGPHQLAQQVADAVLGDRLAPATGAAAASVVRERIPAIIEPSALAGVFYDEHDSYLTLTSRDGKAWIELDESLALADAGNGRWTLPAPWNLMIQAGDQVKEGQVRQLQLSFAGAETRYTRIDPAHPSASELDAYAGTYWSDELMVPYEVVADHASGTLTVRRRKHEDQTFVPLAEDVFGRGSTRFGATLTFEHGKRGSIAGFRFTAGRVRNLRFTRRDK